MAQPLDPLTPAVPPRPPLRHRVPGQGPSRQGDGEDAGDMPLDDSGGLPGGQGEASVPETPRHPDGDDDDDHLIDDYA